MRLRWPWTPRPLYIFDLDGTLALIDHRRHILDSGASDRWQRFYAACVKDLPNVPIIATLRALRDSGAECWVWSGRSDEVVAETEQWLHDHGVFKDVPLLTLDEWPCENTFRMRRSDDYTPDDQLKRAWLHALSERDRKRLVGVFDDRDKVVAMWRDNSVACLQVAPGNF